METLEINKDFYTRSADDYEMLLREELETVVIPRLQKEHPRFKLRNFNICTGYGESAPIELWFERSNARTKALWAFEAPYLYHYLIYAETLGGSITDFGLAQSLREVIVGERTLDSVAFNMPDTLPRVTNKAKLLKLKDDDRFTPFLRLVIRDLTVLAQHVENEGSNRALLQILWLRQMLMKKSKREKYIENFAATQDINHAIHLLFSPREEKALTTVVSRCVGLRSGDYLPFSREEFQATLARENRFQIVPNHGQQNVDNLGIFRDLDYHLPRL